MADADFPSFIWTVAGCIVERDKLKRNIVRYREQQCHSSHSGVEQPALLPISQPSLCPKFILYKYVKHRDLQVSLIDWEEKTLL